MFLRSRRELLRRILVAVGLILVVTVFHRAPADSRPLEPEIPATSAQDTADLISLNLTNVDLLVVVELLAHDRGLNVVAPPNLDRTISVRFKNVNWKQALTVVLQQCGYGIEQIGNILRIDTLERLARKLSKNEYQVRYIGRGDLDVLCRTIVTGASSYQIVEEPGDGDQTHSLTVILTAPASEQDRFQELLSRMDRPSDPNPIIVRALPNGTYGVEVEDMPVAKAMDALGHAFSFSVVWEDPPRGRAAVKLEKVSVTEALNAVLAPLGFACELSGHVLRVGEKARFQNRPESRVLRVRFVNPIQVKALLLPLLSKIGRVEVLGDTSSEIRNPDGSPLTVQQRNAINTSLAAASVGAATTLAGTNAFGGINSTATALAGLNRSNLSRQRQSLELPRGQPPSGTLLVTDIPAVLAVVEQTVRQLDKAPELVEIETKVVEVTLTKNTQLGISWDANVSANGASGQVVRFPLNNAQGQAANPTPSITLGTLSASNFNVMLSALAQKNRMKVLSAPRIATLSHEPARILIGQRFPITVQNTNQTVNVLTTSLDYYEDIGIVLTVTPRVTGKDTINLAIKPEVSSIASLVDNQFPIINTREAKTRLLLRSGHTAVIGGLIQDQVQKQEQGLPGLGSLPIIGRLFNLPQNSRTTTELIVCVTPRIMPTNADGTPEDEDSARKAGTDESEKRIDIPADKPRAPARRKSDVWATGPVTEP